MRWLWWICITLLILFLIAAGFVGGAHFNLGSRTFRCVCQPANNEKDLFFRSGWDGPTGEFTSCDIYGVRVWKWVLRLDIVSDPIGAAKRRLPNIIEGLNAAIDSKDHWRRVCALQRLAELGESATSAIPALLKQLPRDDGDARETLTMISKAAPAVAVPLLTNAMTTGGVTTRCHIVEILTDIGLPASAAVPVLTERLRDSDGKIVVRCAFALSKIGGRATNVVPVLRTLLNSPDSELRAGAVTVLNEFGIECSTATLEIIRLLDDSNLDVRAMAARTLATVRRGSDQLADNIPSITLTRLDSLARGDDIAAQWAIDALSTIKTILNDARSEVRQAAADALKKIGTTPQD
jgi:HEAT repeat protein